MDSKNQVIFLCGARDFHAMDWYKSSLKVIDSPKPIILTDLIGGEGFKVLINESDIVHKIIVLDKFLFKSQSRLGNIWRNILKAVLFPFQVLIIKKQARKYNNAIYYAHSMYYIWLAWAAGLRFAGTPQGSDILLKPYKSKVFRLLSRYSMRSASLITVDSTKMAAGVREIAGFYPMVVQNGIDVEFLMKYPLVPEERREKQSEKILSFRGFTELYRIDQIIFARNSSNKYFSHGLEFIYPFQNETYVDQVRGHLNENDQLIGRLPKNDMYEKFKSALLCISIPSSDSSPRSVYEAIFCGAIVAITKEDYYDDLPSSMKSRIILADLSDPGWFDLAVNQALRHKNTKFMPCQKALAMFDQLESFKKIHAHVMNLVNKNG